AEDAITRAPRIIGGTAGEAAGAACVETVEAASEPALRAHRRRGAERRGAVAGGAQQLGQRRRPGGEHAALLGGAVGVGEETGEQRGERGQQAGRGGERRRAAHPLARELVEKRGRLAAV